MSRPVVRILFVCIGLLGSYTALRSDSLATGPDGSLGSEPGKAAVGDWPQWRGPNRDGISAEIGLLKEWPEDGPPLLWKTEGLGAGFSSLAVVGDKIFTAGDTGDDCFLRALNRSDGKLLWSLRVGRKGGGPPGPRSTPTVDKDLVFILGQHGDLLCAETATGKEVWSKNLPNDLGGKMMSGWGYSESLLVDGDRLICTPGGPKGTLAALNRKTGELIWQTGELTDASGYSSVVIAEIGGVRQYVQWAETCLFGVAPESGKLLWRAEHGGKIAIMNTPIVHDNHVFVSNGYSVGTILFKITVVEGKFRAEQVYADPKIAASHGGIIRIGDYVYFGGLCMELKTGKAVTRGTGGAITCADGHIYSLDQQGRMSLVEAVPMPQKEGGYFDLPGHSRPPVVSKPPEPKRLPRPSDPLAAPKRSEALDLLEPNEPPAPRKPDPAKQPSRSKPASRGKPPSWAHPVVAGGKLYLRDDDVLFCFDVKAK